MPFPHCIAAALADQLITQDEAAAYNRTYDEELHARSAAMLPHEAAAEAARATFAAIEGDVAERRRQTFLSIAARADITRRLDDYRTPSGAADPFRAAAGLYDRLLIDRRGLAAEQQHLFWQGQAHAHLDEAFMTWKRNYAGVRRNKPGFQAIVREAFGEASGDPAAKALIEGWRKTSSMLRQAFNRFGGHIGELEDWGLPQVHRREVVEKAGETAWIAEVMPRLDRSRMRTREGSRPLNDVELRVALHDTFKQIETQGWVGKDATPAGGRALANRHADHRFLHFKSADDWLAYQTRFGEGDPVNAMLAHVDRMSRDIGLMQVMGPNPAASLAWLKNDLTRRAALLPNGGKTAFRNGAVGANKVLTNLHVNYTRSNSAPVAPVIVDALHDLDNVLMSAQLGSAIIPAVPGDLNTQRMTRAITGLPEVKMIASYIKQLASSGNRMAAIRAGLTAQHYARTLHNQGRYTGELFGHPWSQWINDRVQAASGLTAWTAAGRAAFGLDFFGHVADQAGVAFGDLNKKFSRTLGEFGIDAADWDTIRETAPYNHGGATFIRPGDIFERADLDPSRALALASKLADAAMTLTEHAVPSNALRVQAAVRGQDHPGEFRVEAMRSLAMYHTFSGVVMLTHGRRMMQLGRTNPRRAGSYVAGLALGGMLAGAVAIQTREIANLRDPRDMTDWRFWQAALVQSGGFGLLTDFIYATLQGQSRTGGGLAEALTGPRLAFVTDVATLALGYDPLGPAKKTQGGTSKNAATRALDFAKRNAPFTNLWYTRGAVERLFWDHIQELTDPGWQHRVRQRERFYRQNFGNEFWWHPGDVAPERAPDPGSAIGAPAGH